MDSQTDLHTHTALELTPEFLSHSEPDAVGHIISPPSVPGDEWQDTLWVILATTITLEVVP